MLCNIFGILKESHYGYLVRKFCFAPFMYAHTHVCMRECAHVHIVTDFINAFPGNSSVNTVQHATVDDAVFSVSFAPSSCGTTGLCKPLLGNDSVNTFPRIGPCYESGGVMNNRDGVFREVCA
jgi:hypothetical protein